MTQQFKIPYTPHERQHPKIDPKSMTHQSMAPECDINTIMQKYERTGVLEHRNNYEGQYGDFADGPLDYHESMNSVIAADEMFQTLPARIRRRFHNDAGAFIDYATNPENQDELIELGLATRLPELLIDPPAPITPKIKATPPAASPKAAEPPKSE